jgi:hypothetical protein
VTDLMGWFAQPWVLVTVALLVVLVWYLSWTAARLDRLHARLEGARAALDAQLVRRASVTLELATSGLLDPASSILLADAAHGAREATEEAREYAESDLSRGLRAALEADVVAELSADPVGRELLADVGSATHRVTLARRFHNDAVRAAVVVRRKRTVRLLRLAGHAPVPPSFEMDDAPPPALAR